jgi:regulator-associated protein of mTOR
MMPLLSDHTHPNPLASHALTPAPMNGAANLSAGPQSQAAATASRPSTAALAHVSPASDMDEATPPARPASIGPSSRPGLMRAKSDFGPRHPAIESADEGGSVEGGHFKIRHGWDDQLNSEEYSHLLTSVRYTGWFSCCGEGRIQDCG